jgi:hypothetical protein
VTAVPLTTWDLILAELRALRVDLLARLDRPLTQTTAPKET